MSRSPDIDPSRLPHRSLWMVAFLGLVVAIALLLLLKRPHPQPRTVAWTTVARSNLVLRAGRWCSLQNTNPFTGWMMSYYPDGSRLSRCAVSNGLLNGVCEGWFANGQIKSSEHFKDSVSTGPRKKWHENGQLKSEATIVNGVMEGTFRRWYADGQLAEEIEMKHGQPNGVARAYYRSGFLKAETRAREGKVLGQQRWKDGERREASMVASLTQRPN